MLLREFKYYRIKLYEGVGKPLERLESSLTLSNLWLYSIKLISDRPMFSRELYKGIKEKYKIKVNLITVYSVLYRLEREGYIKRSGNYRKYYEVTEKGRKELQRGILLIEDILKLLK
jgi:PadR family transcriptional regulator PadR